MTPEERDAFMQARAGLPRQGPGLPADVHWAVETIGLHGAVDVFDAGCGPGDDMVALAKALPEAQVTGVDMAPEFIDLAAERLRPYGSRVRAEVGDMAAPTGTYDLIWCAGAIYFLGLTDGLRGWRGALKPGGRVAVSEPVLLQKPATEAAVAFWADYPQITDLAGLEERVTAAGFNVLHHRMIVGAPWEAYYTPMQAHLDALRAGDVTPALQAAIDENQAEIDRWRAAPDDIAYALMIVAPA
ncbi:class I SAM-dependent methyltransferase [Tateyamaria sp. SN6-1]|uniref:class I SAM-dependent methyltransferase n=1 Tax=Tateyamaria sp. SN6-1 TaxID=3092148 RepID=UPI0039F4CFA3